MRIFWWSYILLILFGATFALGHSMHFTDEENAWLNRQYALDGMKCCDRTDTHVGQHVTWRITGGKYEVRIGDRWYEVPAGRLMNHKPDDPNPWQGEALLFYSPGPNGPNIWCFFPPPLM